MSRCIVVMYHYVRDVDDTGIPGINAFAVASFKSQLDWLCKRYTIIDYDDFHAALTGGSFIPKDSALLTFDDGLVDHYETVLPILIDRHLSGVFFVPTHCFVLPRMLNVHRIHFLIASIGGERLRDEVASQLGHEKDLSEGSEVLIDSMYRWDTAPDAAVKEMLNYQLPHQIAGPLLSRLFEKYVGSETEFARSLYCSPSMLKIMSRAGMTLGGHTWNHRALSRLPIVEQREELGNAPELIRELTGQPYVPFCYPYGHPATYSTETLRILALSAYSAAFTAVAQPVRFYDAQPFELPRMDTRDLPYTNDINAAQPQL